MLFSKLKSNFFDFKIVLIFFTKNIECTSRLYSWYLILFRQFINDELINLINMIALFQKTIVCVGLCLLFFLNGFGQYNGSIPQLSTVTPNVAALFKASQRPMGSFTGTTPIVLPLYTVTAGEIEVPVTLSYSNGGIGVQEVASWTGLGWNLFAGGRIMRIMRGVPDDGYGGMLNSSLKPSGFPSTYWLDDIDNVLKSLQDLEPDIFYFDCNGLSGKFYFDEFGSIKMVSQQAIKIEPIKTGNVITSWLITDSKGIKYSFGQGTVDQTSVSYNSLNGYGVPNYGANFISSWHLVEIKDMNEENAVSFSYTSSTGTFGTSFNHYLVISGITGMDCSSSDFMGDEVMVTNSTSEYYLTKIEGRNDSLVFYSSTNRKDYNGGRKLDSLHLFARNNQLRKRSHFVYDYFSIPGAPSGAGYDELYKRLKLGKVSEFGTASNDSLTHKLDYIESVNLPARSSRGIDYWGFYNGMDYNSTLTPNGSYTYGMYTYRRENLGERRAEPYWSIANTLEKITYPTGGSRKFVYEGNKALVGYDSQMRPDAVYYNYPNFSETGFYFWDPYTPAATHDFTVNSTEGNVDFNFYLSTSGYYGDSEVKIIRVIDPWTEYEVMSFPGVLNGTFILDNGDYRIEVYHGYSSYIYAIDCSWQEQNLPNTTISRYGATHIAANMNVGGIRVKEVEDYDPVSNKTYKTKYKYYLSADTTLSSGLLISPIRVATSGSCGYPNRDCYYVKLTAESEYPLAKEGGAFVVYPEVKTLEEGNGYVEREYSFAYDAAPGYSSIYDFPVTPPYDASWQRGQMQNEKVYNNNGQLIKHSYAEGQGWGSSSGDLMHSSQTGYKVAGFYQSYGCNHVGSGSPCQGCYKPYTLESQFAAVKKTFERTYNATGTAQEAMVEYDYYTNLSRPLIKEQQYYLNNGAIKKISYKYAFNNPGDFVFGLTGPEQTMASTLLTKNFLEPLEVSTTITPSGGTPVITEGIKYSFDIFNSTKIHLASTKKYGSASDYKEIICSAYDGYGNLLEKYQPGEAREVYLWGYNKTYPVAKIIGSDYSTISAWVTPSILDNPANAGALRTHLASIRSNLAGTAAQVDAYTFEPLVGMTSVTDSKGLIRFYEYDHFMRLKNIKDHDGNILKSYQYHYKP